MIVKYLYLLASLRQISFYDFR